MRIIDADELKQVVESELAGDGYGIRRFTEIIDNAPAIEAVQMDLHEKVLDQTIRELFKCQEELEKARNEKRPQGEWELSSIQVVGENWYKCSICGRKIRTSTYHLKEYPFCHCGAEMRKGDAE